jgi:hypothetical protein
MERYEAVGLCLEVLSKTDSPEKIEKLWLWTLLKYRNDLHRVRDLVNDSGPPLSVDCKKRLEILQKEIDRRRPKNLTIAAIATPAIVALVIAWWTNGSPQPQTANTLQSRTPIPLSPSPVPMLSPTASPTRTPKPLSLSTQSPVLLPTSTPKL